MDNIHWLLPDTPKEAINAQKEMAGRIQVADVFHRRPAMIAGMDVSNMPFDPAKMIYSAVVMLAHPSLKVVETTSSADKQRFPYIPGLLGFREAPILVQSYSQLSQRPDVIMVDGHGISHPRGLGIASHLGVLLDVPTIGVAKSLLIGEPAAPLADEAGSMVPLVWKEREIGMVLRTKRRCHPVYVSAGHKIGLKTAVELVMSCVKGYRLPEPIRQAHLAANACRLSHARASEQQCRR